MIRIELCFAITVRPYLRIVNLYVVCLFMDLNIVVLQISVLNALDNNVQIAAIIAVILLCSHQCIEIFFR
jgi:hypothetical protein